MKEVKNGYVIGNLWFPTHEDAEQFEMRETIRADVLAGYAGCIVAASTVIPAIIDHIARNYTLAKK